MRTGYTAVVHVSLLQTVKTIIICDNYCKLSNTNLFENKSLYSTIYVFQCRTFVPRRTVDVHIDVH